MWFLDGKSIVNDHELRDEMNLLSDEDKPGESDFSTNDISSDDEYINLLSELIDFIPC